MHVYTHCDSLQALQTSSTLPPRACLTARALATALDCPRTAVPVLTALLAEFPAAGTATCRKSEKPAKTATNKTPERADDASVHYGLVSSALMVAQCTAACEAALAPGAEGNSYHPYFPLSANANNHVPCWIFLLLALCAVPTLRRTEHQPGYTDKVTIRSMRTTLTTCWCIFSHPVFANKYFYSSGMMLPSN